MTANEFRDKADTFTMAYLEAALWSSTLPPFGECPLCHKDTVLDKLGVVDGETPVCSTCSDKETSCEPPADDNYDIEECAPELLDAFVADCAKFQADHADLLIEENLRHRRGSFEGGTDRMAGHDFWLTRNGHGAGFWDGDWEKSAGKLLTDASHALGEVNLYVGDDGKVYA